jgi:hypothetical protein
MIILEVQVQNISAFKTKREPVISADPEGKFVLPISSQGVEIESREVQIADFSGAIQDV